MDPIVALLTLEEELLDHPKARFNASDLEQHGQALAVAVTSPEGYTGAAWKCGARLLQLALETGLDLIRFFAMAQKLLWATRRWQC